MTPDEIERLTQREKIETFVIRYTVERVGQQREYPETTVEFRHDTGKRKHISCNDVTDVAGRVRYTLQTCLRESLERDTQCNDPTYATVENDDRSTVAERARWAVWRLAHPEQLKEEPEYTVAKDHGLLRRLWSRMLELESNPSE